ncbi:hypothetical protein C8R45DRAFT_359516 [Mycena sanguinolenta]|nr:hypothetical protein C8R45DRAFT_359516 [Mycena sanguinolenta]
MVKIYVADRTGKSDAHVWVEYDVDLADPVRKLKTDIYETEGVAVGRQCLQYDGIELRDEQFLGSYALQEGYIVDRLQNKILVKNNKGDESQCEVDLDGRLIDLKEILVSQDWDLDAESSLEFNGQVLQWDDGRPLSSLGIRHNDSVVVSFAFQWKLAFSTSPASSPPPKTLRTHKVLYDWNGAMKHPAIAGLPLRRGTRVIEDTDYGHANRSMWGVVYERGEDMVRYFPRNYIRR